MLELGAQEAVAARLEAGDLAELVQSQRGQLDRACSIAAAAVAAQERALDSDPVVQVWSKPPQCTAARLSSLVEDVGAQLRLCNASCLLQGCQRVC